MQAELKLGSNLKYNSKKKMALGRNLWEQLGSFDEETLG
jgi:hypothetical protein